MDQIVSELLSKNWFIAVILVVISIVSALVKIFSGVINTHEEVYLKRDFKRLLSLRDNASEGSDITGFIEKRIEEEAFALASGIRTSPEKKMLTKLYKLGFLSKAQLKRVANNLTPVDDKIKIELGWFEKSEIIYSFWASIVMFIVGFSGLLPLISKPSIVNTLFAIATFGFAFLVTLFVGGSYQNYKILHFTWKKLKDTDLLANPELAIKTRFVYTPE